jgi:hypothetical protein
MMQALWQVTVLGVVAARIEVGRASASGVLEAAADLRRRRVHLPVHRPAEALEAVLQRCRGGGESWRFYRLLLLEIVPDHRRLAFRRSAARERATA